MTRQWYSSTETSDLIPGLASAISSGLDARQIDDRGPVAVQGLTVEFLEEHPPVRIVDLPTSPPRYLDPDEMGQRLIPRHEVDNLGTGYSDVLTGAEWTIRSVSAVQSGHMATASALFRALRVSAPPWRLVTIDGLTRVGVPLVSSWVAGSPDVGVELPVDLWLAYTPTLRGRLRVRANPIPGFPSVIRWAMHTALGYSAAGHLDSNWGLSLDASALSSEHLPMLRRIDRLSDRSIRRAVVVAGLPTDKAAALYGTLISRREILRARLAELTAA